MTDERQISKAVISRLPRYYRYLGELMEEGIERISSNELSARMKVTASQIRQDLNCFGGFGQQGYGYSVSALKEEIARILGLDGRKKMILLGAGKLAGSWLRSLAARLAEQGPYTFSAWDLRFMLSVYADPTRADADRVGSA